MAKSGVMQQGGRGREEKIERNGLSVCQDRISSGAEGPAVHGGAAWYGIAEDTEAGRTGAGCYSRIWGHQYLATVVGETLTK